MTEKWTPPAALVETVARAIATVNEQDGGPPWDHPDVQNKHVQRHLRDQAHAALDATPLAECIEALDKLLRAGKHVMTTERKPICPHCTAVSLANTTLRRANGETP